MKQFKAAGIQLGGFAAESVNAGDQIRVLVKAHVTSDNSIFFLYAEQIASILFSKINVSKDIVDRMLVVIHEDNSADVYLNDFQESLRVKVNKDIAAGEAVYASSIDDIAEVRFPDIKIQSTDRIIYLARTGWRFGLFFNFSKELDIDELAKDVAKLKQELLLTDILQSIKNEIAKYGSHEALIITEGKTDWRHIKKAFSKLGYVRILEYDRSDKDRGDSDLLKICEALCIAPQRTPVICIFDNDNENIQKRLNKITGPGEDFQKWGNNVFSMMLPVPAHRKSQKNIAIEMYYTDEEIATPDQQGKRLFFNNELKKEILPDNSSIKRVIAPMQIDESKKKIDAQDAAFIVDDAGKKVGLSKMEFAQHITNESGPGKSIQFDSFKLIAKVIDDILKTNVT